jgi:hypothetical protein
VIIMICSVKVYKKMGYVNYGKAETDFITIKNSLVEVRISRARDTQTAEATVIMEYENLPLAAFQGGTSGIIDNFARIEIWFDDTIEFTGVIKKYKYNEDDKTITLTCHDMFYRLLNACDGDIKYGATTAVNVISDLVHRAGLTFTKVGGTDYNISNLKIEDGTVFMDVIQNFIETMHAVVRCSKSGIIYLEDQYPAYIEGGGDNNHFDWTYRDRENVSEDNAGRDATLMKNILKITCPVKINNKEYIAFDKFEDTDMTTYLNDEKWYDIIDNPLANTQAKRKAVAGWQFLECWRNSTSLTIMNTNGNKSIDIGQVVKLIRGTAVPGYYLVVGVDTEVSADNGYIDTLQLQGMKDKNKVYTLPKLLDSGLIKEE